jgi:hypothetical protein
LGVKKAIIRLQSPKTEFGAQHQYGRVTYPSIRNFTWSKKKYTFGGQKSKNKPSEPKNLGLKISKTRFRTKKIKTSRHFKKAKMHSKKLFLGLKRKKQARHLVNFKRNKQEFLKLLVFILIMFHV